MNIEATSKLIEMALQIQEPWKITDVQFSPEAGRIVDPVFRTIV